MTLQNQTLPAAPARFLLTGVPRVGFYQGGECCPEDVPLAACLRACLDYFGEGFGCRLMAAYHSTWRLDNTYTYLMGASGCAFRLAWRLDGHTDPTQARGISGDQIETYRRAFAAAGYDLILLAAGEQPADTRRFRAAIQNSLVRQNRPVIAVGVVGPAEPCLITGYDENGDVLIGWSFFQEAAEYSSGLAFEPGGEFRKRDWLADTHALLVFGKKQPAATDEGRFLDALAWALQTIRAAPCADYNYGSAAYRAWADALLLDADFPDDPAVLRERFTAHDNAVGTVAEGRWYAAKFMEMIAASMPALEDPLLAAAECFESQHDLMWQIWGLVGGNGHSLEHARRLARPEVRRGAVSLILQAMQKESEAVGWIEQALRMNNQAAAPMAAGRLPG